MNTTRYWNECKLGPFALVVGQFKYDIETYLRRYNFEGNFDITYSQRENVLIADEFLVDFNGKDCYFAIGKEVGENRIHMCFGGSEKKTIKECMNDFLTIAQIEELDFPEGFMEEKYNKVKSVIKI